MWVFSWKRIERFRNRRLLGTIETFLTLLQLKYRRTYSFHFSYVLQDEDIELMTYPLTHSPTQSLSHTHDDTRTHMICIHIHTLLVRTKTHTHTFESQVTKRVPPKRGTGPHTRTRSLTYTKRCLLIIVFITDPSSVYFFIFRVVVEGARRNESSHRGWNRAWRWHLDCLSFRRVPACWAGWPRLQNASFRSVSSFKSCTSTEAMIFKEGFFAGVGVFENLSARDVCRSMYFCFFKLEF